MRYKISEYAENEIKRMSIPGEFVESVLEHPEQILPVRAGKKTYQSKFDFGQGKMYLVRAIVRDDVDPAMVLTVYRTSNIKKYWRTP